MLINSSNQSEWLNFNQLTMQLNLMDHCMYVLFVGKNNELNPQQLFSHLEKQVKIIASH